MSTINETKSPGWYDGCLREKLRESLHYDWDEIMDNPHQENNVSRVISTVVRVLWNQISSGDIEDWSLVEQKILQRLKGEDHPATIVDVARAAFLDSRPATKEERESLQRAMRKSAHPPDYAVPAKGTDPKGAEGQKKDQLQLIPPVFNSQVAKALAFGAKRYGPWNWRSNKVETTTYIGAIRRHTDAFLSGQDTDESGASHLGHIAASCAILLDAAASGTLIDNRPKMEGGPK